MPISCHFWNCKALLVHEYDSPDLSFAIHLQGWKDDSDSMDNDDDDDDDDDEAELRSLRPMTQNDADVSRCNLTVPAVGITVTVSPPSPDCSPGRHPPYVDRPTTGM